MYHSFNKYHHDEQCVKELNFPNYLDIFSKLSKVLYIGIGDDIDGLEELVQRHSYVVGIDKYLCSDSTHFHNQCGNFLKRRNDMLKKYPNLHIRKMDAKDLDYPNEYFDGVIFKRSLAYMGDGWGINIDGIKLVLNNVHNVLCENGLTWIIYGEPDVINLKVDTIKSLIKTSGFEIIEDKEDYMICRKEVKHSIV